jgi:hypothetical protein
MNFHSSYWHIHPSRLHLPSQTPPSAPDVHRCTRHHPVAYHGPSLTGFRRSEPGCQFKSLIGASVRMTTRGRLPNRPRLPDLLRRQRERSPGIRGRRPEDRQEAVSRRGNWTRLELFSGRSPGSGSRVAMISGPSHRHGLTTTSAAGPRNRTSNRLRTSRPRIRSLPTKSA